MKELLEKLIKNEIYEIRLELKDILEISKLNVLVDYTPKVIEKNNFWRITYEDDYKLLPNISNQLKEIYGDKIEICKDIITGEYVIRRLNNNEV